MKICPRCKTQLDNSATYCPKCGLGRSQNSGNSNPAPGGGRPADIYYPPQVRQGNNGTQGASSQNNGGKSGFAIASMVCGIVALLTMCCSTFTAALAIIPIACAVVGAALGGISLYKKYSFKGMAIAGLVCSIVALAIAIVIVIAVVSTASWISSLFSWL